MHNILGYTYKKSKKKYRIIATFIFVSVIILNLLLQTLSITINTLHNEVLNSPKLSLILMQDYTKENLPYDLNIEQVGKIENVKFVNKSKPLSLIGELKDGKQVGFISYAIDPQYSYYFGIENMQDDKIYYSSNVYKNMDDYHLIDLKSKIDLIAYDFEPSMIFSNSCFMTMNTYQKMIKELPTAYTEFVVPEYIIGVNNVKNVFGVVKELDSLHTDDDPMLMYQANGLEGLVNDTANLLVILITIFIIFIIFNTLIISFLSSSLVSELSKDLMVLYLNGMSRKNIAKQLSKNCRNYFTKAILVASIISVLIFIVVVKVVLKQSIGVNWIILILVIDLLVVLLNIQTIKVFISKMVKRKTSNENISKIIRN